MICDFGVKILTLMLIIMYQQNWWAMTGSNRRPPRCKRDALPAELIALSGYIKI